MNSEKDLNFGVEMMKQAMLERKWSQNELAKRCEVNRTTITKICTGVNIPSIKLARKIGEILGIDWSLFFTPYEEAMELLNLSETE